LDMRMDTTQGGSAAAWLARASESDIAYVLKTYGEERFAKRIARAIVQARQAAPIATTLQLAEIAAAANPAWERDKHPATRTFQAIRIHINRELDDLEQGLPQALKVLAPGGRLVAISFHSLEDRIVKRFIRDAARGDGGILPGLPVPATAFKPSLRVVGKPVFPGDAEVAANPRARSAVLRVAEKI
jgi:16S rRNA (cytosine1402-N4)-methyltransferase